MFANTHTCSLTAERYRITCVSDEINSNTKYIVLLYKNNYSFLAISWTIASTITALVFMPKFREMNFTSAYEVYS